MYIYIYIHVYIHIYILYRYIYIYILYYICTMLYIRGKHGTDTPTRKSHHDTDRQILKWHRLRQGNTHTLTRPGPSRPLAGSMPNMGNTDTANTGNWAQVHMNTQIGSSQVSAAQSTRTLDGYGPTRPTREPARTAQHAE